MKSNKLILILTIAFLSIGSTWKVAVDKSDGDVKGYFHPSYNDQHLKDSGYEVAVGETLYIDTDDYPTELVKWVDSNSDGKVQANEIVARTQSEIDAKREKKVREASERSIDGSTIEGKRLRCSIKEVLIEMRRQVQLVLAPRTGQEIQQAIKQCIRTGGD